MPKVIVKVGYIKAGGKASGYMKYIATRERVEKLDGSGPVTERQQQLIEELIHDFPDAKDIYEYADYITAPTFGNASAFINAALDMNASDVQERDGYMKYIATRPGVERHGDHGLFSNSSSVSLNNALSELDAHTGNVWTLIFSLHREDAERLGYDSAESWRRLILSKRQELAKALKISQNNFRWYAAFHDEGHHPHIHMMVWSSDPKEGFLTTDGMEQMRSVLTNSIFHDELRELYVRKDLSYKEIVRSAQDAMLGFIEQMESEVYVNPVIEQKMAELVINLGSAKGKKQYAYLNKSTKAIVDSIVDELAKQPSVAQCYEVWNELRDDLDGYYHQRPRKRLPLSQQKEFRAIKNMVIREAENIRMEQQAVENEEEVLQRLHLSAAQGDEYEQRVIDHANTYDPPVMSSVMRLMYHVSHIFRENSLPPANPLGIRIDSKRRRKLMQKRLALGHKLDDHEEEPTWQQTMH